jgi:hypothetical protein
MSETTLAKIAVSSNADEALSKFLERVNQNFEGGRVTKTDLASWCILHVSESLTDSVIEEIHQAHFNQVVYLETLVRKMKASGRENLGPEELSALQALLGQQTTKKRGRAPKASGDEVSDNLKNSA